jgi:hypothetical protein
MTPNPAAEQVPVLESFRAPETAPLAVEKGTAMSAPVTSIISVASHTFTFNENTNTPGRFLEQSVVDNVPSGAGYFTTVPYFRAAFTTSNFQHLTERPLGQVYFSAGLRGNNLVCGVRLTDSNSDDPISIVVTCIVVFYR